MDQGAPKPKAQEYTGAYFPVEKVSVDFKIGGVSRFGRRFPSRLRVVTESSVGQRITVYIGEGLDDVFEQAEFKRLTDKRLHLLLQALPEHLRIRKEGTRTWFGDIEASFSLHPDDMETWRHNIMVATDGPGKFLPTGEWVRGESSSDDVKGNTSVESQSAPHIVEFYRSLGKPREIIFPAFGFHYTAFIFESTRGKVAIVAAGKNKNADYVFDARTDAWIDMALKTKLDVLTDPDPQNLFLGRIIHSEGWRERVQKKLNEG